MTTFGASQVPPRDAAFFTVTYVEVGPPATAEGATLLTHYRDASCLANGAVRFQVLQRLDRPNQFTVLTAWADQEAYEAHTGTAHLAHLSRQLAPLLAAPNDTRQHHGLAVEAASAARHGSVTAVTHVDVIPQHKDEGADALAQLARESRKHTGNLRFDVWRQINRPNHFTVVETWSSRRAFDAHGMAAETMDFRTRLAVMTGALYDERLYRTLA